MTTCPCGVALPTHLLEIELAMGGDGARFEHVCSCTRRFVIKEGVFAEEGRRFNPAMPVHWSSYASQPDVQIYCDESWGVPAWGQTAALPEGVHLLDDGRAYTFEREKATCSRCRSTAGERDERSSSGSEASRTSRLARRRSSDGASKMELRAELMESCGYVPRLTIHGARSPHEQDALDMLRSWLSGVIARRAAERAGDATGACATSGRAAGVLPDIADRLKSIGFACVATRWSPRPSHALRRRTRELLVHIRVDLYVSATGVAVVDTLEHTVRIEWESLDAAEVERLRELVDEIGEPPILEGSPLFTIVHDDDGLSFFPVPGPPSEALERGNYRDTTLTNYDRAVTDLRLRNPAGRLVVITGPTGTGKTRMVEGMMEACPQAMFVHCPPTLIAELEGPRFLPLLLSSREDDDLAMVPVVLIVEDGDACLVPRGVDNMSQIGALLSLADGRLGRALDVRVIVTTNAESLGRREKIDPALMRPGRLSAQIHVPTWTHTEAGRIYERIERTDGLATDEDSFTPLPEKDDNTMWTLAEIYAVSRGDYRLNEHRRITMIGVR